MKNKEFWQPTKFVFRRGKLRGSRCKNFVGVGSRLSVDIIGKHYQKYLQEYASGELVDLGCGLAPLYEACKDYVSSHICIDWPNTVHHQNYIDIYADLCRGLPLRSEIFNTILISDVLEHIANPENLWCEFNRILVKEGLVIANVPFFYWIHEAPYDFYRYTQYSLANFAENSGFKVLLIEATGGTPEIVGDFFAKHLQFIPLVGKHLAIMLQYFVWVFIHTNLGKYLSDRTKVSFPFGFFMIAKKVSLPINKLK